jgi:hypothetical protein
MRLSKNQLDHLQQAARFPGGRSGVRDSVAAAAEEAVGVDTDERSDRAMEEVIRATEQVARAADNVIRAAQDAAPVPPIEVLEPDAPDILSAESTPQHQIVQVPPFTRGRRSRISLAVALLALAFGAGAAMSWLVFGEPSRTRDQVWNLVSAVLEPSRAIPPVAGLLETPSHHPPTSPPSNHGAANAAPATVLGRSTAPSGGTPNETTETALRAAPIADGGRPHLLVPPPASVSLVATAPVKVAGPPSAGSGGIASGEPSTASAVPSPGAGVGVLENDPSALNARPGERSLSGIVLGALPVAHPRAPDKTAPDQPQSPAALPESGPASPATEAPAPESLTACLAARPTSLRLAREETARLLKRGEEFMGEGRVSAARLMFQRAAEACDVRAAFALGASYDPIMLQKLGVALLDPDIAAARSWYLKAKELGSAEATQELELLSNWRP